MKQYYEGWYYKQQCGDETLSLIPGRAEEHAFIQVITNDKSFVVNFPLSRYRKRKNSVIVGDSIFSSAGVLLAIEAPDIVLYGRIRYSDLTPLPYDIMGPFALLPMQTKHTVVSMNHTTNGSVWLNGRTIPFYGGKGYIEGDRGTSFPKSYAWVQCNDFDVPCSIMLSIAHIPVGKSFFWGCIGVVWLNGEQIRLATYRGVEVYSHTRYRLEVEQRPYRLVIEPDCTVGHPLTAPQNGEMTRTIHENAATNARFRLYKHEELVFEGESDNASFEYVE